MFRKRWDVVAITTWDEDTDELVSGPHRAAVALKLRQRYTDNCTHGYTYVVRRHR